MKRTYSIIIIILMAGSVFGTLAYYTLVTINCPTPVGGTPVLHGSRFININGTEYTRINVTFTAKGEKIASSSITFQAVSFLDPTIPHFTNGYCTTEPNAPFQVGLVVIFTDGASQALPTISFGGNPPAQSYGPIFISHGTEQAGVQYLQGENYVILLLSSNAA